MKIKIKLGGKVGKGGSARIVGRESLAELSRRRFPPGKGYVHEIRQFFGQSVVSYAVFFFNSMFGHPNKETPCGASSSKMGIE